MPNYINLLGIAIMLIGRYSGHFGKLWILGVGCTSRNHTRYKWRLAMDWEVTIKRAVTVIIMLAIEQKNGRIKVIPAL